MDDNEKTNGDIEDSLYEPEPCCLPQLSSTSDSCGCGAQSEKGLDKGLKMVIFIIVMLSAFVVAAHSLLKEKSKGDSAIGNTQSFASALLPDKGGSPVGTEEISDQPAKADEKLCGISLDSIKSLSKIADEKKADVVFILLSGENRESASKASSQVETTLNKLLADGKKVEAFTLKKNAQGYDQLVKQFSVSSLPCVIVSGKGCGSVAVSGEITESKLLGAFVKASVPASCESKNSSESKSGSPCCPK